IIIGRTIKLWPKTVDHYTPKKQIRNVHHFKAVAQLVDSLLDMRPVTPGVAGSSPVHSATYTFCVSSKTQKNTLKIFILFN
ncbi:MAG: hypothetical protein ACPGTQ_14475, partial [Colwellia sp.]